jgi:hypothetical protein
MFIISRQKPICVATGFSSWRRRGRASRAGAASTSKPWERVAAGLFGTNWRLRRRRGTRNACAVGDGISKLRRRRGVSGSRASSSSCANASIGMKHDWVGRGERSLTASSIQLLNVRRLFTPG